VRARGDGYVAARATVNRTLDAPPAAVFAVLATPETYAEWVVGARRIRSADDSWPQPGSQLYHEVGVLPATLRDSTSVLECEPDRRLVLQARARPLGVARVVIELIDVGDGRTEVCMGEWVDQPSLLRLAQPFLNPLIAARNRKALDRLEDLARAGGRASAG
jgi:uncharacterized protein YndB with AHSA1/START domain